MLHVFPGTPQKGEAVEWKQNSLLHSKNCLTKSTLQYPENTLRHDALYCSGCA